MDERAEHIRSLVERPRETIVVELKNWFDPRRPDGVAKLVRASLALRNQNGGFIVVGINDGNRDHEPSPFSEDIRTLFHHDVIQGIISKYASQTFEATVDFEQRGDQIFPVIGIPAGIVAPVACKADLRGEDATILLRESEVYVRTLESNGTVSSARASWRDLPTLTARCFDNREADYAAFLTKMVKGLTPAHVKTILTVINDLNEAKPSSRSETEKILSYGVDRFSKIASERGLELKSIGFFDIALRIEGSMPTHTAGTKFLEILRVSNPDLTGWPVWLDSSEFTDNTARPYIFNDRWEAFIYSKPENRFGHWGELDFMIFDPKGLFFLRRALQDDFGGGRWIDTSGKTLDPLITILRVAEAMAVGQAFSRALGCREEDTNLRFEFRWTGLKGRVLQAWSSPLRTFIADRNAHQDEVSSEVVIPMSANNETIIHQTHAAVLPVSRLFGGYEIKEPVVREFVTKLLNRKL